MLLGNPRKTCDYFPGNFYDIGGKFVLLAKIKIYHRNCKYIGESANNQQIHNFPVNALPVCPTSRPTDREHLKRAQPFTVLFSS